MQTLGVFPCLLFSQLVADFQLKRRAKSLVADLSVLPSIDRGFELALNNDNQKSKTKLNKTPKI